MEPVEIFTILERAKITKLGLICKHGNANAWNEVMCEERAYDALTNLTEEIVQLIGEEIRPLQRAVEDLVMREEGREIVYGNGSETRTLPEDVRAELEQKIKAGSMDVSIVSSFPEKK